MRPTLPHDTPGRILHRLKRRGTASIPELARAEGLNPESIRAHVRTLMDEGLVEVRGDRAVGRGRPERLYAVTRRADPRFPRRESELLQGLARHLRDAGRQDLLDDFLESFAREREAAARTRLEGLTGRDRLLEAVAILNEEGYMAEFREGAEEGGPLLRLCHCPVRELVDVTRAPCRVEIAFVRAMVGDIARVEYIPDGGHACAYALADALDDAGHDQGAKT